MNAPVSFPMDLTHRNRLGLHIPKPPVRQEQRPSRQCRERARTIALEVAAAYGLTLGDLQSDRTDRRVAWPRQHVMHRLYADYSLPEIGRFLGGRDHTTVLHGVRAHQARMAWAEFLILAATDDEQPDLFARAA